MGADDVRVTWAPHLFRGVDGSYYHGPENSPLLNASRYRDAVAQRKAVTVAFLDGTSDDVVQERFAALYRALRLAPGDVPRWRDHLAPREQQPKAALPPSGC
jgi:hypothetical protein